MRSIFPHLAEASRSFWMVEINCRREGVHHSARRNYIASHWPNYADTKGYLAQFFTLCPIWLEILSMRFLSQEGIGARATTSGWILHLNDLLEGMWMIAGTEIISRAFTGLAERDVGISGVRAICIQRDIAGTKGTRF
jgi:hypothetical protein